MMSCSSKSQKADDPLADSGRTQRTEDLLANLVALGDSSVYLFGQHDATVYGIGWQADYTNDSTVHQRSDVKSVCGDHPALLSFDLGLDIRSFVRAENARGLHARMEGVEPVGYYLGCGDPFIGM